MQINQSYLNRFIRTKSSYLYPVLPGIYLSFNAIDLKYIGLELYYSPRSKIDDYANKTLEKLLSLGYIEIES